ncbi:hypothetical protein Q7C36_021445 [Tachysurus vachellii]|uniref:Uncharacterized protein n=1 Tax=Tachysurus vachellii TaxID=175792 RepID=A0AA88LNJ8_TACVA|nr:hypothetical protein Q7C36_021445 [Tachysurus vachellii]
MCQLSVGSSEVKHPTAAVSQRAKFSLNTVSQPNCATSNSTPIHPSIHHVAPCDYDDGGMAQAQKSSKESERKEGERKQVGDVMGMVQLCADSFVNSPRTPSCLALIDS